MEKIMNVIDGQLVDAHSGKTFEKYNPSTGELMAMVPRSDSLDIAEAMALATDCFYVWSRVNPMERGKLLRELTKRIEANVEFWAEQISREAGKSLKDARGEVAAVVEMGYFVSGEATRYYGKITTSAMPNRESRIKRAPVGVCGLITPANNPFAAVAWKAFPALMCGNTCVMKPSEDTPIVATLFATWLSEELKKNNLPPGIFSLVHGLGSEAGRALVSDPKVRLVSFTGSVATGLVIQKAVSFKPVKLCLELGGKNALVVCDDANMEVAVDCAILSAFSNAGQRCAAGSRIIVFESVYEEFVNNVVFQAKNLQVGMNDRDAYGPVISVRQLNNIDKMIQEAKARGVKVLVGGHRLTKDEEFPSAGDRKNNGYYYAPTILEGALPDDPISRNEIFGPVVNLYVVHDFDEAVELVNDSEFGLTAAIHTYNLNRAREFEESVRAGVISINGKTYGSEPHMPFGGFGLSGNGYREAGTEALDLYSDWKIVYEQHFPHGV